MRLWRLSIIVVCSMLSQGCLAAAWIAAVGTDSLRTSDVTFWPFERSWVSKPVQAAESQDAFMLTSMALMPVEGDPAMGGRLVQVLQQQTPLRIESTAELGREIAVPMTDEARAAVARDLSLELVVDAVLFGYVSSAQSRPSDWGWKSEESRRLFLYLVDDHGRLLWKDELPFTVITGSKPPIEQAVQTSLAHHLMDHARDLGLDSLGYLPRKIS